MIYVFDLDDTICYPEKNYQDSCLRYANAVPNWKIIDHMRILRLAGHIIIIHTARRMLTHSGNIDLIKRDVEELTIDWLVRYNVPYDELVFGKPYGDFYIDDKAINVKDFEL